jgi:hypothetical protein
MITVKKPQVNDFRSRPKEAVSAVSNNRLREATVRLVPTAGCPEATVRLVPTAGCPEATVRLAATAGGPDATAHRAGCTGPAAQYR